MNPLTYGSVCSGIEAATVAWEPLGWKPAWFAEIEKFPSVVLAHHYPEVENLGDFTRIERSEPIDLLVGGTPCQSFSVAGKRGGLDDSRGVLAFEFLRLARRIRPRWVLFENVPGMLSSGRRRDFGAWLGALGQCGYGFAYRVLDAQYFGVPQRRRRVFVVGYLGDWRRAAAVLFEPESLRWDSATGKRAQENVAALTSRGVGTCGADDNQGQAGHLVTHSLRSEGFDASEDGTGRGTPIVPILEAGKRCGTKADKRDGLGVGEPGDPMFTLQGGAQHGVYHTGVRRLTPRECERLQGFPDDYTLVPYRNKPSADGPRYKALGNSMAVPVMAWLGQRISLVEKL